MNNWLKVTQHFSVSARTGALAVHHIIPSPLLFWDIIGKTNNPSSLQTNEMVVAERIICKSLIWNLNFISPIETMFYMVAIHKSLLYFVFHFLLPSQEPYIILYRFSLVYIQPLPLSLALSISIYTHIKIKQSFPHLLHIPPSAVFFSFTSQWNFQSVLSVVSVFSHSHLPLTLAYGNHMLIPAMDIIPCH